MNNYNQYAKIKSIEVIIIKASKFFRFIQFFYNNFFPATSNLIILTLSNNKTAIEKHKLNYIEVTDQVLFIKIKTLYIKTPKEGNLNTIRIRSKQTQIII